MHKELLTEPFSTKFQLFEDKDRPGIFKGKGPFGRVDYPTSNGRIYTRPIMEREIKKLQPLIEEKKLYGELDHPGDGKTKLSRCSHRITELYIDEEGIIQGCLEVMMTDQGRNLAAILDGGTVDVSSRAFGSVKLTEKKTDDGKPVSVVQDDLNLKTWDVVSEGAGGEYAHPEFVKEDIEIAPEKKEEPTPAAPVAPAPAAAPEAPAAPAVPAATPAAEPEKPTEFKILVDSINELKNRVDQLSKKLEEKKSPVLDKPIGTDEVSLHVENKDDKKIAGYVALVERKLEKVSDEVRKEVIELVGNVSTYVSEEHLERKVDRVLDLLMTKERLVLEKDNQLAEAKRILADKSDEFLARQRVQLREKLDEKKRTKIEREKKVEEAKLNEHIDTEDLAYAVIKNRLGGMVADQFDQNFDDFEEYNRNALTQIVNLFKNEKLGDKIEAWHDRAVEYLKQPETVEVEDEEDSVDEATPYEENLELQAKVMRLALEEHLTMSEVNLLEEVMIKNDVENEVEALKVLGVFLEKRDKIFRINADVSRRTPGIFEDVQKRRTAKEKSDFLTEENDVDRRKKLAGTLRWKDRLSNDSGKDDTSGEDVFGVPMGALLEVAEEAKALIPKP
jgi:hypothetical protein